MTSEATPITSARVGPQTPSNIQFLAICDDAEGLTYRLKDADSPRIAVTVRFGNVIAYRVADEGVLLDYWSRKLANTSHLLWELKGTEFLQWMESASLQAHAIEDGVRHFIVVTATICLEALTMHEPTVEVHD